MLAREKVVEALSVLGQEVPYTKANNFLIKKYGREGGISDAAFYNTRRAVRSGELKLNRPPTAPEVPKNDRLLVDTSAKKPSPQNEVLQELTVADLMKARRYCKEFGGRKKLSAAIRALGDLSEE